MDAGPLIAADRGDRRFGALVKAALRGGTTFLTTEAIVAQVWRGGARQAQLARALRSMEIESEFGDGRRVGELLAATGTSDVVDAHLAVLARKTGRPILTDDVDDFTELAAAAGVRIVPWRG